MMWELRKSPEDRAQVWLDAGWEPFAVTQDPPSHRTSTVTVHPPPTIWMRRIRPGSQ